MVIAMKLCFAAFSRLAARHFLWLAGQPQYIFKTIYQHLLFMRIDTWLRRKDAIMIKNNSKARTGVE